MAPAPPSRFRIAGQGVTPGLLAGVADRLGLGLEPGGAAAPADLLLLGTASAEDLRRALVGGVGVVIDADDPGAADGALPVVGRHDHIHMTLRTARAFQLEVAPLFCEALVTRGWVGTRRRADVELCVHEAVNNAIVHGNLGIRGGPSEDPATFDRFFAEVRSGLADPLRARRRLRLDAAWDGSAVEVRVGDEGEGFQPTAAGLPRAPAAKSGRGLHLMRELSDALSFDDDGRSVCLRFRR